MTMKDKSSLEKLLGAGRYKVHCERTTIDTKGQ